MANELEKQVDAAFSFRGNVTIALKSGEKLEAYVFNRGLGGPKQKEPPFIEIYRKGKPGQAEKIVLTAIDSIDLSGKDHAKFTPPPAADE